MSLATLKQAILNRVNRTLRALRRILFGHDFFISYAQSPESRLYGATLESLLAARDYVCFRDTTSLNAGDKLTLTIRWSLRRTRCLIVLGTDLALRSTWVAREIDIFCKRRRTVVVLDLEKIRARHAWTPLEDALFANDTLPLPSSEAVDSIDRSFQGMRTNQVARWALVTIALAGLCSGGWITWQAWGLRTRTLQLRNQAIVSIAQGISDPLVKGLVLQEVDAAYTGDDATTVAREVALADTPFAVLRTAKGGTAAMAFSIDGQFIFQANEEGDIRRWPVDGLGEPTLLCKLGERISRIVVRDNGLLCCNAQFAAFVNAIEPADPQVFRASEFETPATSSESADDELDLDLEFSSRSTFATPDSAWQIAEDSRVISFCRNDGGVFLRLKREGNAWQTCPLPLGNTVGLDVGISSNGSEGGWIATVLNPDGKMTRLRVSSAGTASVSGTADLGVKVCLPGGRPQARAIFDLGTRVVCMLQDRTGIVVADMANEWKPRIYKPEQHCKSWIPDARGTRGLIQMEDGDLLHLHLSDFAVTKQPDPTRIQFWSSQDYVLGPTDMPKEEDQVKRLEFDHPGLSQVGDLNVLVTLSQAWLWSTKAARPLSTFRPGMMFSETLPPVFSENGTRVAIAELDGEIRVWDASGATRNPRRWSLDGRAFQLATAHSGRTLVGTTTGSTYLLKAPDDILPLRISDGVAGTIRTAISGSGSRGAAISSKGRLELFDLDAGRSIAVIESLFSTDIQSGYPNVLFLGEGHLLAWSDGHSVTLTWAQTTPQATPFLCKEVRFPGKSPDGPALVKTSETQLEVWNVLAKTKLHVLNVEPEASLWGFDLSPKGNEAAAGLGDGSIRIWTLQTARRPRDIRVGVEGEEVFCVAFDPRGRHLAFATAHGRAGLVSLSNTEKITWFQSRNLEHGSGRREDNIAHVGVIGDLSFSADGTEVLTCSGMDGLCKVWQMSGHLVESLYTGGTATFGSILPDGRAVTLTEQGHLAIWTTGFNRMRTQFQARSSVTLLPVERMRYLREDSETAYERYCQKEKATGRRPLPRDYVKILLK